MVELLCGNAFQYIGSVPLHAKVSCAENDLFPVFLLHLDLEDAVFPDSLAELFHERREVNFIIRIDHLKRILILLPGGNVRIIVSDQRLHPVECLVYLRFQGLPRFHLIIERPHIGAVRLRQRRHPVIKKVLLPGLIALRLDKCRDVSRKCLSEVVDQAHADHLIHIRFRKLISDEQSHQCHSPAVLRNALPAPAWRITVPHRVLQTVRDLHDIDQFSCFHHLSSKSRECSPSPVFLVCQSRNHPRIATVNQGTGPVLPLSIKEPAPYYHCQSKNRPRIASIASVMISP